MAEHGLSETDQHKMVALIRSFTQDTAEQTIAAMRELLLRNPLSATLYNNLGVMLRRIGRNEEAEQNYLNALKTDPDNGDAAHNLGNLMSARNNDQAALKWFTQAVDKQPDHAPAWENLGCTYRALEMFQDSRDALIKAVRLRPDQAETHNNLAVTLWKLKLFAPALCHYRRALAIEPEKTRYLGNCGVCLMYMERYEEALAMLKQAHRLTPEDPDILGYLGQCCISAGDLETALDYITAGLQIDKSHLDCNLGRARALLLSGDLAQGWRAYEWRWKRSTDPRRATQWHGEELKGKTLHLMPEQGAGDIIQFIRYIPLLERQGAKISITLPDNMRRLIAPLSRSLTVIGEEEPAPPTDYSCTLLDIPKYCAAIPASPYLTVPDAARKPIEKQCGASVHLGLIWAGNPKHKRDSYRSIPLKTLLSITHIPGLAFYSLQKGERARDLHQTHTEGLIPDLVARAEDYADTANVIAQLDVVITVDTSVAHLAAALGKPTWMLLPQAPDWRWMLARTDTPWYPTMRIFRTGTGWDLRELISALNAL